MPPVLVLVLGALLIWAGATGRVESVWNALIKPGRKK